MIDRITAIKKKLDDAINQLCEVSWMFSERPGKDFTRSRKLPFRKVISFLLSMEGGSLTNEMLKHFGCSADIASTSAFVQQRGKINADTVPNLFSVAVHNCRQFFLGNVSPPNVEALIQRHSSPIRPGRSRPRNMTAKHAVSFTYRVA